MGSRKKVLFICTHNSARSQMAEAFLNNLYGDLYEAYSAGTHPSEVHPLVKKVMIDVGVDISTQYSKSVETFRNSVFDYVITVCDRAKQTCPFFPGGKIFMHQSFEDPAQAKGAESEVLDAVRRIRDEVKNWIIKTFGKSY